MSWAEAAVPAAEAGPALPHQRQDADGVCTLHLMVDGIHCAGCVRRIERALAGRPGVVQARVNLTTRRLTLAWRQDEAEPAALVAAVEALGFRLMPFDPEALRTGVRAEERTLLRAMAVAGFAAANVMLLSVAVWAGNAQDMGPATRGLLHWVSALIALPAVAYAGRPFFAAALTALKARRTNMDVPISLALLLTAGMSLFETASGGRHVYFDSALALMFFLLVGRYLESRARDRARSAAENLLSLAAGAVTILDERGGRRALAPEAVEPGMTALVAAGERVAVDGTVREGVSDVDTSLITGESMPATVGPGARVFAGTLNLSAPLHLVVAAVGEGTLLAEIARLMATAEQGRARHVALADRIARLYAPVVHGLALATFLGWMAAGTAWQPALLYAVAVLIVTCPCALGLAIPAVQVVAGGRLLRAGVLLKSATALERLAEADMVVFDKTGTLTLGRPSLVPGQGHDPADLRLAASLAGASKHPLARALAAAAPAVAVATGVREVPGAGLAAATPAGEVRLGSRAWCGVDDAAAADADASGPELWLAAPGRPPVRFAFADPPRPDAAETVRALARRGYRVELLSGDRPEAVAAVADRLGIAEWQARQDPVDKLRRLEALAAQGHRPLMVGDGLNDAPSLAAAYVSMSPATAADITRTAADAVFQGDRLGAVAETLAVARRAGWLVRQSLGLALLYNAVAVPLAVLGLVTPLVAAAAMSSSSLLVVANALRLGRGGTR